MLRDFAAPFRTARRAVVVAALLAIPLSGCGIKGPLKLPPTKPASAPPATENPAANATPANAPAAPATGGDARKP